MTTLPQTNTFISFNKKEKNQLTIDNTNGVKPSSQFHTYILSIIQNNIKRNIYNPEDADLLRQYQIALSRNELDLPEDIQKIVFELITDIQVNIPESHCLTTTEAIPIISFTKQPSEPQTLPSNINGALIEQQSAQVPVVSKPPSLDVIPYPEISEQSIAEHLQNNTGIKTNYDSESEEEMIYYRQWPSYTGWIQKYMNQSHGAVDTSKMSVVAQSTTMGSALGRYESGGIEEDKKTDYRDSINIQKEEEIESFNPIHQDEPNEIERNQIIDESLPPEPETKTHIYKPESKIDPGKTNIANGIKIIESDLFINNIKDRTTSIRDGLQSTNNGRQKEQEGKEYFEKTSKPRREPDIKNQTASAKKGTLQKIVKKLQNFITSIIKRK